MVSQTAEPWFHELAARVPGADNNFLEENIVRSIKEFCSESTAWREWVEDRTVSEGERAVDLQTGLKSHVLLVHEVLLDGRPLHQVSRLYPESEGPQQPRGWVGDGYVPGRIFLTPVPDKDYEFGLKALVSLTVGKAPCKLPTLLTEMFYEAVLDGTLGRLYMQPRKPYSDREAASFHLRRFRRYTRQARDMASRGFTPGGQNWSYPSFGR